ncbi:MAG: 4Fe-4S dicluster domain-containing protein [Candidatus Omnitrophica bacterium]|nr:4Fe-4S dicluster domain-containing protein [Candidatus Omnitrophota bacterium]
MIVSVASGKGGTGKTTIAVNLALSVSGAQLLDCDVEEPNSHLFLRPEFSGEKEVTVPVPAVDAQRCTGCGKCAQVCQYHAIAVVGGKVLVFPELCHGCGACAYVCPEGALKEEPRGIGVVQNGKAGELDFAQGVLHIGQAMAPPLIKAVKKMKDERLMTVIDAPPGTSCPMITAVKDSDYVVLVTEPTPFGLNDLTLAVEVVRTLGIPCGVVVNKADLGDRKVFEYCDREGIPVLMEIPFSRQIAEAYSEGRPFVTVLPEWKRRFAGLRKMIEHQRKEPG